MNLFSRNEIIVIIVAAIIILALAWITAPYGFFPTGK